MIRFDALTGTFHKDTSAAIQRSMTHVMSKVYEKKYNNFKARKLIPVNNEGGTGLSAIEYLTGDFTGQAKFVGTTATDLGVSNAKMGKESMNVATIGTAAVWTHKELENFQRMGTKLSDKKAMASRRSVEQLVDETAALGNTSFGLKGMFSDLALLNSKGTGTLIGLDGDEMIDLLLPLINDATLKTDGEFVNDSLIMTPEELGAILAKRMPNSDMPVLEYLMKNTSIKTVGAWSKLNKIESGKRFICAYPRDSEVLELLLPRELEYFNLEIKDLQYKIPGLLDIAGTVLYQPKLISYIKTA